MGLKVDHLDTGLAGESTAELGDKGGCELVMVVSEIKLLVCF